MFSKTLTVFVSLYIISLATTISGMEIFSGLIFLTLLWGWKTGRCAGLDYKNIPFSKPILLFVCITLISTLICDAPGALKFYYVSRMRFFLVFFILFWSFRVLGESYQWKKPLQWVLAVMIPYGITQHFIPLDLVRSGSKKILLFAMQDEKIGPLVIGTFNHHLTFSNVFLFYACVFLALGLGSFPKRQWQTVWGVILFLLVAWTHSRAAWLAIPLCVVLISAKLGLRKAFATIAVTASLMMGLYFGSPSIRERFHRTFNVEDQGLSYTPRLRLWMAQIEMFKDHPLLGIGWNNNERVAKEYVDRLYPEEKSKNFYGHAHSEIIQILACTGIVGLLAYLWLWGEILLRNFRLAYSSEKGEKEWLAVALFAGFIGFHAQGITQWNFGDAEVVHNVMFFWALLGSLLPNRSHPL